ncbi:MAG: hypothetical protein A2591_03405 [Candidatus Yonathbacteria bacterium RIFOXYD1_FULL_52_36]|uniref:Glucanase n=1 Tax=Candidatus Yonathbacteria bacterium RIFOXYD1_FULL_52_36 TaxID=1802730 RepID=A0A1G2SJ85_9BACT|nr:MAG: hypothetical protein A2591_03405 [Candidatus Yonathbacteria bacterium RIFOXYD1_FULL_52_36]
MLRTVLGASIGALLLIPFAASASTVSNEAQRAYTDWKSTFVTSNGAGSQGLRVNDPSAGNITVSEGQGYGMLLSVRHNDRATFDALWRYTKSHLDQRGLMHWKIDSSGNVTGANSATDGDEDIGYALLLADRTWGGSYLSEAKTYIDAMYQYEVEAGTYVLKPGDVWGGSDATNPSYFAPAYYREFAKVTGNNGWLKVLDKSYEILFAARDANTGLLPEWTTGTGESATRVTWNKNRDNFTYNAIRVPWRMAMDWVENKDPRAKDIADKMNHFFASQTTFYSGYTFDGKPLANYLDGTFMSGIAVGSVVSSDAAFRDRVINQLVAMKPSGYYSSSYRALALLTIADAEGSFPRIAASVVTAPVQAPAPEPTPAPEPIVTPTVVASTTVAKAPVVETTTTPVVVEAAPKPTVETAAPAPVTTVTPEPKATETETAPVVAATAAEHTPVGARTLEVMLPGGNSTVSGEKKLKVKIEDLDPKLYTATWSVDGGQENSMENANPSLKQAKIQFDNWTWHGEGPYKVTFTAKDSSGSVIGQSTVEIFVKQ